MANSADPDQLASTEKAGYIRVQQDKNFTKISLSLLSV